MNVHQAGGTSITVGAAVVSLMAQSLPVLQWIAAAIAIIVGARTLYKSFK